MTVRPRKAARPPVPRESEVLKGALSLLKLRGVLAWRANCGGMSGEHKGKRWHVRFGVPGQCDLTGALPDGRRLEVEVKRPGESPTSSQIRFMQTINKQGCVAFWTDDVDHLDLVLSHVLAGCQVDVADDGTITVQPRGGMP